MLSATNSSNGFRYLSIILCSNNKAVVEFIDNICFRKDSIFLRVKFLNIKLKLCGSSVFVNAKLTSSIIDKAYLIGSHFDSNQSETYLFLKESAEDARCLFG